MYAPAAGKLVHGRAERACCVCTTAVQCEEPGAVLAGRVQVEHQAPVALLNQPLQHPHRGRRRDGVGVGAGAVRGAAKRVRPTLGMPLAATALSGRGITSGVVVVVVVVRRERIAVASAEHPVRIESCRCPARPPSVRRRAAHRHHLGQG